MSETALEIIDERDVLGKQFRIYGDWENPLFLARDVAMWIEYDSESINKMLATIDDSEKLTGTIFRADQKREMWLLTEDGLYEVLMQSRKPIAKQFKTKVKEILKDVRKHGMYMTTSKVEEFLANPDNFITVLSAYKSEKEQRTALEKQAETDKPKVLFADSVLASSNSILVRDLAKLLKQNGIDIGGNRLYERLRQEGFLIKQNASDWNHPTQKSVDLGLFEISETTITRSNGHISVKGTPKITGKGQVFFINYFKNLDFAKKSEQPTPTKKPVRPVFGLPKLRIVE